MSFNRALIPPLLLLALIVAACAAEPLLRHAAGDTAAGVSLLDRFDPPSAGHWLGTDELGRDEALRLLAGGRVSLLVGLLGASLATLIGTLVGLIAGTRRGWADAVLMRMTDAVMTLPLLPLLIVLAAIDLTKLGLPPALANGTPVNIARIVLIASLVGWTGTARLVRGAVLSLMARDFIRAAAAMGATRPRIMRRHLLPNLMPVVAVAGSFAAGSVITLESALSFIGVGIQPPAASWGNMLSNAQELLTEAPDLAIYPGLCLFLTVIACNLIGDALQAHPSSRRTSG